MRQTEHGHQTPLPGLLSGLMPEGTKVLWQGRIMNAARWKDSLVSRLLRGFPFLVEVGIGCWFIG